MFDLLDQANSQRIGKLPLPINQRCMRVLKGPGPGVLWRSVESARISMKALPLKIGFERSNALRGTMLIEPASAMPGDSGVGE